MNFKALALAAITTVSTVAVAAPANANPADWHCTTTMGWETCMNLNLDNDKIATDLEITGPNGHRVDVEIACSAGDPFIFTTTAPLVWGGAHAKAYCMGAS